MEITVLRYFLRTREYGQPFKVGTTCFLLSGANIASHQLQLKYLGKMRKE